MMQDEGGDSALTEIKILVLIEFSCKVSIWNKKYFATTASKT
jgi:hypothetical protein